MTDPRPLKYWHVSGSICTTVEQDGAKAVVFLTPDDVTNLDRWYMELAPMSDDALDLRRAIDARDQYLAILRHAD